ncbi:FACT complex subunit SPT16 N-terminal lobe domain-domain-containing protein [Tuber borchii]|uniref:FACT complex subunit n=1 Tax=Tuber borchii TaxID=42251 RepID=A0A2T6ZQM3_TUBBO|nr:FACT complex subunit SPT16 N-terminal lobe domain-domain-containing protein [Tuber borchii]
MWKLPVLGDKSGGIGGLSGEDLAFTLPLRAAKYLETLKGGKFPIEILVRGKDEAQNTQNFKDLVEVITKSGKKVGAYVKDKAEGPFVNDWKKIFPAEIEGVEEFDVSSAISQCLTIKDDLELDYFIDEISTIIDEKKISHVQLSQKIEAKIDDDKFFRAKEMKLASDSTLLPSPPSNSTVLLVLASDSTGIWQF